MCHIVSVMGYGNPEKASSHLLNKMTEIEMDIHKQHVAVGLDEPPS